MKTISLKKLLFLPLLLLMIFSSCQEESTEITNPDNEETLVADSNLANLMRFTVFNDGSVDNIIDFANCLEVQLPVTVIVNDITITINSLEDLDLIEDIFDEFEDDENDIEIVFPITIISADYTEIVIENQEALDELIRECNGENEEDDDIECIDFQYPISISIYNTDFDVIDTVTIDNDEALYDFIENLEGGVLASLNFPVTMILSDGSTIVVENNADLEAAITASIDACDEDDDNDWDDDDEEDCNEDYVVSALTECHWYGGTNLFTIFVAEEFYFLQDGTVEIYNSVSTDLTTTGTWSLETTATGVIHLDLEFDMEPYSLLNDMTWEMVECDDDDRFQFVSGDNELVFEQSCEGGSLEDCGLNLDGLQEYLLECGLEAEITDVNGDVFDVNQLDFNEDGVLIVNGTPAVTETAIYVLSEIGSGYVLTIDGLSTFALLNGEWFLEGCDDDDIIWTLITTAEPYTMALSQDCRDDEFPFDCFYDAAFTMCDGETDDNMAEFDLDTLYLNVIECNVEYNASIHESLSDAESNSNAISNTSSYINNANPQTLYVRVESLSGDIEIYEIQLFVEACSSGCSEDEVFLQLVECTWNVTNYEGDDNLANWDFIFNGDGTVVISGEGLTVTAMWSVTRSPAGQVLVSFTGVALPDIQEVDGEWLVVECAEGWLQFTNNDDVVMIMEQDCP